MLITPTRRDLLKLLAAVPAFSMPLAAKAQIGAPQGKNPAYFRFSIGDIRLTILSDGFFQAPVSGIGVNADPAEVKAFLASYFLSETQSYRHTNHLLIETGQATVLVDVGSGSRFFDTTGRLMTSIRAAGIDPDTITHVVITHAHPDHIWGIRDDFDEAIFPDAEYILGQAEYDYWMQDDLVNKVAPTDQQFVLGAVNSINVDGVDWTLARDGHEVAAGVSLIATPGHTPGHMSVRIDSQNKTLIALGDALTHAYTNFAHPDWYGSFDLDGDLTVQTRRRLLDMAASDRIALVGYHFPFPGVGHVQRDADVYRFIPALWQFEG